MPAEASWVEKRCRRRREARRKGRPTIPGKASVTVTAAWGWSAIPPEIIEAVKILGKGIVELRNSRGGVIASDVFGPVRVSRNIAGQSQASFGQLPVVLADQHRVPPFSRWPRAAGVVSFR